MSEAIVHLTVRLLAGILCAAIGAFFGALVIAMLVSGAETSDQVRGMARIGFVAVTAAAGSRAGWFGTAETIRQSASLLLLCVLSGVLGSWIALVVAGAFFDHTDLYVLNRDISGAGFFGAVLACNIPSFVFGVKLVKRREI